MLEHLFSPLALGPVEIRTRIVSTAHQTTLVHDNLPTDDFVAYHEARARGGAGLIVLEATAVHPSGLLTSHTLGGYLPEIVAGYERVAAAVQPHGTRLSAPAPARRPRADRVAPARPPAVIAPSWRPEPALPRRAPGAERRGDRGADRGLRALCGTRGRGRSRRRRALRCTPVPDRAVPRPRAEPARGRVGRREPVPDGSRPGGARAAAPDLGLGVRLSADSPRSGADRGAARRGGRRLPLARARRLGHIPRLGRDRPAASRRGGRDRRQDRAFCARAAADRDLADDRRRGRRPADRSGRGRGARNDARADHRSGQLPAKAREGRLHEIVGCIGCNACIAHYHAGTPLRCAVNPRTVGAAPRPAGGDAGEASDSSWSAAVRPGSRRRPRPGAPGTTSCSSSARIASEDSSRWPGPRPEAPRSRGRFLANAERQLEAAGVEVRLGADDLPEADGVVLATGARPQRRPARARGRAGSSTPGKCSAGTLPDGQRVVVADWGGDPGGLDAAEDPAAARKEVTLAVAPGRGRRARPPVPAKPLPAAAVPRGRGGSCTTTSWHRGRCSEMSSPPSRRSPSRRTPSFSRTAAFRSTVEPPPGIPAESAGAIASRRARSRRRSSRELSAARRVFA